MISFPNCKINLGLKILQKRTDGFHDLETVFYPIQLTDILEIIESEKSLSLSVGGLMMEGDQEENICLKAYRLLKKDFPDLPFVKMHLHKIIPIGAGLGGGSADAVFMLQLLDKKFSLGLSEETRKEYALQLGSDCPFFLVNKPCLAAGRGEILEQVNLDLSDYKFLIVVPGIHISTAWAFSEMHLQKQSFSSGELKEVISKPIVSWKGILENDFEKIIFSKHPEILLIKEKLYEAGAVYSSMSGSGSAVYGIFKKETALNIHFPGNYFVKELAG